MASKDLVTESGPLRIISFRKGFRTRRHLRDRTKGLAYRRPICDRAIAPLQGSVM